MEIMEMAEMLEWTPQEIQQRREEIQAEDTAEGRAKHLRISLSALKRLLGTAVDPGMNADEVFQMGQEALLAELHSDDPEQTQQAQQVRQACLETLIFWEKCLIWGLPLQDSDALQNALPALTQLTQAAPA